MSEIVIIGGGASGMMAAARLSVPGSRVHIFERNLARSCLSPEKAAAI